MPKLHNFQSHWSCHVGTKKFVKKFFVKEKNL
jgi:hypothetical protein